MYIRKKTKLMLIGGTGFIGKGILGFYLNKKNRTNFSQIIINSRKKDQKLVNSYKKFKNIKFLFKNISKIKKLPHADIYIYAASNSDEKKYSIKKNITNSINGFKNFLKIIKKNKQKNSKYIYLSSGAVYGLNTERKKLNENKKNIEKNILELSEKKKNYAKTKILCEKLIKSFSIKFGYKFLIVRLFAFYGKSIPEKGHFFLSNIINAIKEKKKIKIKSKNLKATFRSFMHTDDLARWLIFLSNKASTKSPIYNIGSDRAHDLHAVLTNLEKKFKLKIQMPKQNPLPKKIDYYIPSIKKAKKLGLNYNNNFYSSFKECL